MTRTLDDPPAGELTIRFSGAVLTIGNFDAVHRGHQYLLSRAREIAAQRRASLVVVTFEPHPIALLRPESALCRLLLPDQKDDLLRRYGADHVEVISFDHDVAQLRPEAFLDLLFGKFEPSALVIGDDFRFGRNRAGDWTTISQYAMAHGATPHQIPRLTDDVGELGTSRVRDLVQQGSVEAASAVLGRRYRLRGVVAHGHARGRELGFPTANLLVDPRICVPSEGIFAGYAHVLDRPGEVHAAMIYIGTNPTFENAGRTIEANLLDFEGDLYARELELEFVAFIRGDRRFGHVDELVRQMAEDERNIRACIAAASPEREVSSVR